MHNPTAVIQRCTAQSRKGSFCDRPTAIDMPFPICAKHAQQVYERWGENVGDHVASVRNTAQIFTEEMRRLRAAGPSPEYTDRQKRRQEAMTAQSQVYYVRIGDHVKIGVTVNMKARLSSLRIDEDAVLATEPGDYTLERERHLQFAAERVGRRENFNPSRRLLAHIEQVRATHGEPNITGYPKVA